jgi:hypothetical protein
MLPLMISNNTFTSNSSKKLLVLAEGFEARSLSWINNEDNMLMFDRAFVCRYSFHTKTRFDEVFSATKRHCSNEPEILEYDRFDPTIFEKQFLEIVKECKVYEEVFIDISVMSKMLIMIIMYSLKFFNGNISIIYSEPETWGPLKEKYEKAILEKEKEVEGLSENKTGSWISLSSVGVGDVVRTPNLSSVVMQNNPTFLISFLSFNEQLFGALVNEISPSKLQLMNHSCKRQDWREKAMERIHDDVINEYFGNDIEPIFSADVLDYIAVFEKLAKIYREHCYKFRIVISPTGAKVHTIAATLLKICCPDVHIEYPTPESYLFDDYSSNETHAIHKIVFENFKEFLISLSDEYKLNG